MKQVTQTGGSPPVEGKAVTRLRNFAIGFAVASVLVGPTAWADVHQKAPSPLALLVSAPQQAPSLHISNVVAAVRTALFSTTP